MKVLTIFSLTLLFALQSVNCLFGQENRLEVISSAGTYVCSSFGSMSWTIGEVCIATYASSEHFLTQGFHQPANTPRIIVHDFFIPEGFSPNDDGINDLFVIRGIDQYPNNTIQIFNRWGNIVYETIGYKNTWDGKSTMGISVMGDELPVSTYFYLFDFGDGSKIRKGTIYLNR